MSASAQEMQALADQILVLLNARIRWGQIIIHYDDGHVQRVETNIVHKPTPRPLRKPTVD